ncbi:MAG: GAF domain-containing protein, partial [Bradymonadia bacterium]
MRAPDHPQNAARLAALAAYGILDTQASVNFDEITALVSRICDTPIALISLVDRDRQWFLSEKGLGMRRTSMESSVCAHAILQDEFFEIDDLTADARFADNPMVLGHPHIRFYAGAVLRDPGG